MKQLLTGLMMAAFCSWLAADSADTVSETNAIETSAAATTEVSLSAEAGVAAESDEAAFGGKRKRAGRGGGRGGWSGGVKDRRGPGEPAETLTPQQIEDIMAFAKEHFPDLYDRLNRLKDNPKMFQHMIQRARGPMFEMLMLQQRNPELADTMIRLHQLEMKLHDLRNLYRSAKSEEQREDVKSRIREQLDVRFDLRVKRLRLEIVELEKRLERSKNELKERESGKDVLIDKELEQQLRLEPAGRHEPRWHPPDEIMPPPPPPPLRGEE